MISEQEMADFLRDLGGSSFRTHPYRCPQRVDDPPTVYSADIEKHFVSALCQHGRVVNVNGVSVSDEEAATHDAASIVAKIVFKAGRLDSLMIKNPAGRKGHLDMDVVINRQCRLEIASLLFTLKTRSGPQAKATETAVMIHRPTGDLQAIATAVYRGANPCGLIDYLIETDTRFDTAWSQAITGEGKEKRYKFWMNQWGDRTKVPA